MRRAPRSISACSGSSERYPSIAPAARQAARMASASSSAPEPAKSDWASRRAPASTGRPEGRHSSTACMVVRSSNSSMLGVEVAMICSTARPAAPTSSKSATTVTAGGGSGRRRSRAMVTIPRVPSLPTMSPARSYPATPLTVRRPNRETLPSASTTSRPSTASRVTPYFTQHSPPALVLTLPPIEQKSLLAGSGAYHSPCSATCSRNSVLRIPGSVST